MPSGVLAWDSTGKIIIANSTALSLLDCQQLTRYRQLESLLQEKGKKEHLSLSQSRMKLQDKTITLLSIKDIGDELSDKESESWNKLSHVLTHEIMNTIAPIISLSQTLSTYPDINEKQFADFASFKHKANVYCNLPNPSVTSPTCQNPKRNFSHLRQPCKISGNSYPATSKKAISSSHWPANLKRFIWKVTRTNSPKSCSTFWKTPCKHWKEKKKAESASMHYKTNTYLLTLRTTARGIPPELQEKIFIPFFTTKSEGSGIGLSLCKQIIRLHDGHLTIQESNPGKTIFHIDMPL